MQINVDFQTMDHIQSSSNNPSKSYVDQSTHSTRKTFTKLQEEKIEQASKFKF